MAPQLRRKPKVDDLASTSSITKSESGNESSASTPAPVTDLEPEEQPSSLASTPNLTPAPPLPPRNPPLHTTIPPPHTHFTTSPLLVPNTPSILLCFSPSNYELYLSRYSASDPHLQPHPTSSPSQTPNPLVSKEIKELEEYEDVSTKGIRYTEEGRLVLMSKVGYEGFVRSRRRRGKALLT